MHGTCASTCDKGERTLTRKCIYSESNELNGKECIGDDTRVDKCETEYCPVYKSRHCCKDCTDIREAKEHCLKKENRPSNTEHPTTVYKIIQLDTSDSIYWKQEKGVCEDGEEEEDVFKSLEAVDCWKFDKNCNPSPDRKGTCQPVIAVENGHRCGALSVDNF